MRILSFIAGIFLFPVALLAQVTVETGHSGQTRDGALIVYGSDNLKHTIPYERIHGSPFWQDKWMKAFLFNQQDTPMGIYPVKYNFATNELHYLDKKGKEWVAIPGTLNAVVIMSEKDSAKIETVFRNNIPEVKKKARCKNCFVQELNQGDFKLLRITQRQLSSKDSLFFTQKTYHFKDDNEYFIEHNGLYDKIKRLHRDLVFTYFPGATGFYAWVKKMNIDFTKEEDLLKFINYYNDRKGQPEQ